MINRPMLIITIGYIIGIIWGLYLKINIPLFVVFYSIVILCAVYAIILQKKGFLKRIKDIWIKRIVILFCSIFISFSFVKYKEYKYDFFYKELEGDVKYVGSIVDINKESKYYNNYVLKISTINGNTKYKNTKVLLKVKKQNSSNFNNIEYGNLVSGVGKISKPEVRRNYMGFDYSEYLKTKGISTICESNQSQVKAIRKNSNFLINMRINNIKNRIKNNLAQLLTDSNYELALALLLGDSNSLSTDQKEMYSEASLSHILAISGMHVSYVIIGCSFAFKKFGKIKSRYFSIIFLIFFSIFTGNSPSVLRAVIMGIIMISSKLFYRKSDIINNIAISCFIILFFNPYSILNLGFQLSFAGTLGIVLFYKKISNSINRKININNKLLNKTKDVIVVSVSANILIFPIILYNYNTVSIVFLFSNILVTPILGLMLFCGYLTAFSSLISSSLAKCFAVLTNIFFYIFNLISKISSNLTFMRIKCVTPSVILILVYYCVIIYIAYFYNKKHLNILKKIIKVFIIISLLSNYCYLFNPKLKIHFVDVGQGDCTLILTSSNKSILIDGGGNDTYDVGKNVLVPYLLDRKIAKIDYMIISHFDSDHVGGLLTVLEELKVKQVIISMQGADSKNYKNFKNIVKEKNIRVCIVGKGDRIKIEKDVYIDILWPNNLNLINENILNNNSIVCKLNYRNVSILFTGDIEEISENQILIEYKNNLKILNSTILKVGHHGSKTSSSTEFINAVRPQFALIGVGENNKFGHPNEDVLSRLRSLNVRIYRTDENGEISIEVNKEGKIYAKKFIDNS